MTKERCLLSKRFLFNNAWGTKYVQWYGEDMRFRFIVRHEKV